MLLERDHSFSIGLLFFPSSHLFVIVFFLRFAYMHDYDQPSKWKLDMGDVVGGGTQVLSVRSQFR